MDQSQVIVIDEVQKIPELLNEVHRLIQKKKMTFLSHRIECKKVKAWSSQSARGSS